MSHNKRKENVTELGNNRITGCARLASVRFAFNDIRKGSFTLSIMLNILHGYKNNEKSYEETLARHEVLMRSLPSDHDNMWRVVPVALRKGDWVLNYFWWLTWRTILSRGAVWLQRGFCCREKIIVHQVTRFKKIHYSLNMFSKKKDPKGKPKIVKISLSFSNDDFIIRPINNSTIV